MTDLSGLIERVEAAGEGSRELDADIARAIGRIPPHAGYAAMDDVAWDRGLGYSVPAYTTSLDAAMTLKPSGEGHWPQLIMTGTNPNNSRRQRDRAEIWTKNGGKPFRGHAATPALAIVAASLRAQKEQANG